MSNLEQLSRNDGYDKWRSFESNFLRNSIEKRIFSLQNPTDCEKVKILKCYPYDHKQGWGTVMHHIVECFVASYATSRTMVYDSIGFDYNPKKGFQEILQPFSISCTKTPKKEAEVVWPGKISSRVIIQK